MSWHATPMRLYRSLFAVGAAAALVAGCGEGGETVTIEATPSAVARAATSTLDGSSGRFTMTMQFAGGMVDLDLTMDGAFDGESGRAEVLLDLSQMVGQVPLDQAPPELNLSEPMRMVIDGSTVYLCWSGIAAMTGGRPCGSVDAAAAGIPTGGTGDPTAFLRALSGSDQVEEVGREEVDGIDTTHLRGTLTMRQALDAMDPDDAAMLLQQLDQYGVSPDALLDVAIPFEVWIDDDGLVRRMTQTVDLDAMGAPGGGTMAMDMRLFDLGDDIDIDVPDPEDVAPLPGLPGQ